MDPDLDFMEWHDAHLERIVRDEGEVRLEFASLNCYRKLRPGVWDWEIGDAVLVLRGAQVDCDPPGDERTTEDSGWVMDCTECEPVAYDDIQSFGRGVGPGRIAFQMADASTVSATYQHAQLTLVGPLENQGHPYEETPAERDP
ncbi:MAG TPA: hypothetical protein VNN80_11650 [Polyangiaceae bacterium]|nr:hypothetical protein [Polyangiaceae bacterium]